MQYKINNLFEEEKLCTEKMVGVPLLIADGAVDLWPQQECAAGAKQNKQRI